MTTKSLSDLRERWTWNADVGCWQTATAPAFRVYRGQRLYAVEAYPAILPELHITYQVFPPAALKRLLPTWWDAGALALRAVQLRPDERVTPSLFGHPVWRGQRGRKECGGVKRKIKVSPGTGERPLGSARLFLIEKLDGFDFWTPEREVKL